MTVTPCFVNATPACVEIEPLDVRRTAGGHEQRVPFDAGGRRVAAAPPPEVDGEPAGVVIHRGERHAELEADAGRFEVTLDDGGGVGVFAGQHVRRHVEQRHARAEPGEGLRQLAPDRAGADDEQPRGQRRRGRRPFRS